MESDYLRLIGAQLHSLVYLQVAREIASLAALTGPRDQKPQSRPLGFGVQEKKDS